MIATLILASGLRVQLEREARAAFPRECCGLIEGVREGDAVRAFALHPVCNLAERDDRFEIDPADQFRLMRALRGTGRDIVGCYHSHPNGRVEPSPRDRDGAGEDGFVWLIAAFAGAQEAIAVKAFAFADGKFVPLATSPS